MNLPRTIGARQDAFGPAVLALLALGAALSTCWFVPRSSLAAEQPEALAPRLAGGLQYRRVYVPAGRIEELAKGFLPLKQEEFERLASRAGSKGGLQTVGAAILGAEYSARLEGRHLVGGSAKVAIVHLDSAPVGMPFEPGRLALANPIWENARPKAASLALPAEGAPLLLVEESGRLAFSWTLRGKEDRFGGLEFDLHLPASPTSRLTLDLPLGMIPVLSQGVAAPATRAPGEATLPANRQGWVLELGGHYRSLLRIVPESMLKRQQQIVQTRQRLNYALAPSGVNLVAELRLDVHHEPLRRLVLHLTPGLHVTGARLGDKVLPVSPLIGDLDHPAQAVIEFDEPLIGSDRLVLVSAVGPLGAEERWPLPSLRVADAVWQEAAILVTTRPPLLIDDVVPTKCRQVRLSAGAASGAGETWEFQAFSPEAGLELRIGRRLGRLQILAGTTVSIGGAAVSATTRAEISAMHGEHFELECEAARLWTIDSVQTDPPELLDDWQIVAASSRRQQLRIRLRQAITASRGARLIVRAHRQAPAAGTLLAVEQLRLLEFSTRADVHSLVMVTAEPPLRLETRGDGQLKRIEQSKLPLEQSSLLEPKEASLLFIDDAGAANLSVSLPSEQPRYSAETQIAAQIDQGRLNELYTVRIRPEAARVSRVYIHISPAREGELRWSLRGEEAHEATIRRLPDNERRAAGAGQGESWEVTLRRPRTSAFELQAERTVPFESVTAIALASLPEAETQTGMLSVLVADGSSPRIEPGALHSIPSTDERPDRFSPLRATYRYEPAAGSQITIEPAPVGERLSECWAWSCSLETRCTPERTYHSASYRIENLGREQLAFEIPLAATLERIRVNGTDVPMPRGASQPTVVRVPLPANIRFPTVRIDYSAAGLPARIWGSLEIASLPLKPDFPVLHQDWVLWLPRGLELADGASALTGEPVRDWKARLLGAFAARLESRSYWRAIPSSLRGEPAPESSSQARRQIVAAIGELSRTGAAHVPSNTWGQLLTEYAGLAGAGRPDSPPRLLIAVNSLAALGITPSTPLREIKATLPGEAGAELLAASNLELQQADHGWVLTSALAPAPPLEEWQALETWFAAAELPGQPWRIENRLPFTELETRGLDPHALELPVSGIRRVLVYEPAFSRLQAWSWMLAASVLAWLIALRRPTWLIPATAAAGVAALFAQGLWLPFATAAFWGLSLAGLLLLAWRVARRKVESLEDASTRSFAAPAASVHSVLVCLLIVLALLLSLSVARRPLLAAQPNDTPAVREADTIFPVYIPIDEERKPTSGLVYLPRRFYDALHAKEAESSGAARAWLTHAATYQCELEPASKGALGVVSLSAVFEVEVLQPKTTVRLPLAREGLHLFADKSRLNGQAAQVNWSDDGRAIEIEIERPGRHQVEFALQPSVFETAGETGFLLSIPPVPRAKFKVAAPLGTEAIDSPRAFGAVATFAETGELLYDLGASDTLSLTWRSPRSETSRSVELTAEQLLWLKVKPGAVVLETKIRFSRSQEELREVQIQADPRLKLLPPRADQPLVRYRVQEGAAQTISFELKPGTSGQAELHLTFLVSGTSGIGRLALPQLDVVCDRVTRRYLAVSVDADLEPELPKMPAEAENLELAIGEFVRAWGRPAPPAPFSEPQAVFRSEQDLSDFAMLLRTKSSTTSGLAELDASFGRNEAQLRFEAELETKGGAVFQHQFALPANVEISSVSLRQGNVERVARWSRPRRGEVVVFFDAPVVGEQRLVIQAKSFRPPAGDWEVPLLALRTGAVATRQIRVYRRADAQVRLASAPGYEADSQAPLGANHAELGRLAALLAARAPGPESKPDSAEPKRAAAPVLVSVSANRPQVQCRAVTTLRRIAGMWESDVECWLEIDSGQLDMMHLDAPINWVGPFSLEPSAEVEEIILPGQNRKRLVVRPSEALSGKSRLRIRGSISTVPQGRVVAPDVRPLDLAKLERFLVLPTEIDSQQIAWETSGLQATILPPELNAGNAATDSVSAYQVVSGSFRAAIKHVERLSGTPLVRLADVRVAWRSDGSCHGVAQFDLEPAGERECVLEMPTNLELVGARVAGLPALLYPQGNSAWRLELGPEQVPQRVAVVFRGGVPHEDSPPTRLRFSAPALRGFQVEQTVWTICSPQEMPPGEFRPANQASGPRAELARYQTMTGLVSTVAGLVSEGSPRETLDWFASWNESLAASRKALDLYRLQEGQLGFAEAEISMLDAELAANAERLGARQVVRPAGGLASSPDWLFEQTRAAGGTISRFEFSRWQGSLEMTHARSSSSDLPIRLLVAAIMLVSAAIALPLAARGFFWECLTRWPYACGVAIGLCCSLVLWPAPLGWIVVLVSLCGALRSPWRSARLRSDPLSSFGPAARRISH